MGEKRDLRWMNDLCTSDGARWFRLPFTMRWRGRYWCVATDGTAALLVRGKSPLGRLFGGTKMQRATWIREAPNRPAQRAGDVRLVTLRKWLGHRPTRRQLESNSMPSDARRVLNASVNRLLAAHYLPEQLTGTTIRVTSGGEYDAVHFRGRDWLVVIMPMRTDPTGKPCPVKREVRR